MAPRPIFAVLFVCVGLGDAQSAEKGLTDNAALQYWQAFALVPTFDEHGFRDYKTRPVDDEMRKLAERGTSAMRFLHRGARMRQCQWGVDKEAGLVWPRPYWPEVRRLMMVVVIRARVNFHDGRNREAFDDLVATLVLARHVGMNGVTLRFVQQCVMEMNVIEVAAQHLVGQDPKTLRLFSAKLAMLPAGGTAKGGLQLDRPLYLGWFRRMSEMTTLEGIFDAMILSFSEREAEALRKATGGKKERFVEMLVETDALYDEFIGLAALPWNRYVEKQPAFAEKLEAANPLAKALLRGMDPIPFFEARGIALMAMLKVAIADCTPEMWLLFLRHRDPYGDGSGFRYLPLDDGGFRLSSELALPKEGRVTLVVGKAPKPGKEVGAPGAKAPIWPVPRAVPERKADLEDNAALPYWQAFALMPTADEKVFEDYQTRPVDQEVRKSVDRGEAALRILCRAVGTKHCDWGLEWEAGPKAEMPHLAQAKQLMRVAVLSGRAFFHRGQNKHGFEDLASALVLARHVGRGGPMASHAVQCSMEDTAIEVAARYLVGQEAEILRAFSISLAALPKRATAKEALDADKRLYLDWFGRVSRTGGVAAALEGMKGSFNEKEVRALHKATGSKKGALAKILDETGALYDEFARLTAQPIDDYAKRLQEFEKKVKTSNPLARVLLLRGRRAPYADARNTARMAMLKAAIAISIDGRQALTAHKDPYGDGPFQYKSLADGGFELRSELVFHDGKAVTLTVGKPPKPGSRPETRPARH